MSYKVEIQTYSCAPNAWTANALRFDTKANAQAYGEDLAARWTGVKHWRVVHVDEPASETWQDGRMRHLPWGALPDEYHDEP